MRVSVFGGGYVGVVVAVGLAESGNDVLCVDTDARRVDALKAGRLPFHEPGVGELLERNLREGRLEFDTDASRAVGHGLVIFVCVGTPSLPDGACDLGAVWKVAETVAREADGYRVLVLKSTVPVGTAAKVKELMRGVAAHPFAVVSNPEFMKEGAALEDFMSPSRVVIGTDDARAGGILERLYAPFLRVSRRIYRMDNTSAEMVKYASNCFLAMKISFINEIANICERTGADVNPVRLAVGADPRIGPHFLFPGVGYGGSCLPKDVRALIHVAQGDGYEPLMLIATDEVNRRQRLVLLRRAEARFGADIRATRAAVWGLSFKPRTDDVREAPSLDLIEGLLARGVDVTAFDPVASGSAARVLGDRVRFAENMYAALDGADMLFLVTEWQEFRRPDLERMRDLMRTPVVFDGRNIWNAREMEEAGFEYFCIGRGVGGRGR